MKLKPKNRSGINVESRLEKYNRDTLNVCPNCGGPADNGHDRCIPPAPYYCKKCMKKYNKYSCIGDHEY